MQITPVVDPISKLLVRLGADLQELRSDRAAKRAEEAPDFSFFDFCDTSELGLSAIIGWLLDPSENHEQGAIFLEAFVQTFGISCASGSIFANARVQLEASTDTIQAAKRRIDIVVEIGDFVIGIENKPYAIFQPNQIADYCAHLERRSQGNFALLILKGWTGSAPENQLQVAENQLSKLIDSDYRVLQAWLRLCRDRCRAPRVSYFLEHFERFIEEELLTGMSDAEERLIVRKVLIDRSQLLTALDLIAAAPTIYERLHRDLATSLNRRLKRGWTLSDKPDGRERKSSSGTLYLTIDFDRSFPVVFACDLYEGGQHANFAVRERILPRPPVRKLNSIQAALQNRLPGFERPGKTWLWWANSTTLAEKGLLSLTDHNIWKAAGDPDLLSEGVIRVAGQLEQVIRGALTSD